MKTKKVKQQTPEAMRMERAVTSAVNVMGESLEVIYKVMQERGEFTYEKVMEFLAAAKKQTAPKILKNALGEIDWLQKYPTPEAQEAWFAEQMQSYISITKRRATGSRVFFCRTLALTLANIGLVVIKCKRGYKQNRLLYRASRIVHSETRT